MPQIACAPTTTTAKSRGGKHASSYNMHVLFYTRTQRIFVDVIKIILKFSPQRERKRRPSASSYTGLSEIEEDEVVHATLCVDGRAR